MEMSKKGDSQLCAVWNCGNSSDTGDEKITFLRFPRDEQRCKEWLVQIGREDLEDKPSTRIYSTYRVCSQHFDEDSFMNPADRTKLVWDAVPTQYISPSHTEVAQSPSNAVAAKDSVEKRLQNTVTWVSPGLSPESKDRKRKVHTPARFAHDFEYVYSAKRNRPDTSNISENEHTTSTTPIKATSRHSFSPKIQNKSQQRTNVSHLRKSHIPTKRTPDTKSPEFNCTSIKPARNRTRGQLLQEENIREDTINATNSLEITEKKSTSAKPRSKITKQKAFSSGTFNHSTQGRSMRNRKTVESAIKEKNIERSNRKQERNSSTRQTTSKENKVDFIVKIGGGAITNKDFIETVKTKCIEVAALTLGECRDNGIKFIVVHGAGSFGHHQAKHFRVKEGWHSNMDDDDISNVRIGFAKTRESVCKLNAVMTAALIGADCPAVSLNPACMYSGRDFTHLTRQVEEYLESGFIPVVHGDAILDPAKGCTILSGDIIIKELSRHFNPRRVIFLTDVDGVYNKPPGVKGSSVIRRIPVSRPHDTLSNIDTTVAKCDVTGGIRQKLQCSVDIARDHGVPVVICGILSRDFRHVCNMGDLDRIQGTVIHPQ